MPSTSSHPARHSTMTSRATAVISPTIRSLYRVPTSLWDEKLFFANTSFKNEGFLQSALQHLREAPVHSVNDLVRLTFYWSPCYWTYDDLDLLAVRSNFPVKKELLVHIGLRHWRPTTRLFIHTVVADVIVISRSWCSLWLAGHIYSLTLPEYLLFELPEILVVLGPSKWIWLTETRLSVELNWTTVRRGDVDTGLCSSMANQ